MLSHANISSKQSQLASAPAGILLLVPTQAPWEGLAVWHQSPCRLSLGASLGLCVSGYAVNIYSYKPVQLFWLYTEECSVLLLGSIPDGQEFYVSQRDRGCWGVWRYTFQNTRSHIKSTKRDIWSGSICWIYGNCRNTPHLQYMPNPLVPSGHKLSLLTTLYRLFSAEVCRDN